MAIPPITPSTLQFNVSATGLLVVKMTSPFTELPLLAGQGSLSLSQLSIFTSSILAPLAMPEERYICCITASFFNGPTPASFSFIFSLFYQTLQLGNVKNVHPVNRARIRTHNLGTDYESPYQIDHFSHKESDTIL